MSSFTVSAWRRPRYVVTELTTLLANEVLHSGLSGGDLHDPATHGAGFHTDRTWAQFVPATAFMDSGGAAIGQRDGFPRHILTDAVDIILYGSASLPKGPVSLDSALLVLLLENGTGPGNVLLAFRIDTFQDGDPVVAASPTPTTSAVAIAAPVGADDVLSFVEPDLLGTRDLTEDFLRLIVRREADAVGDTWNANIHFLGVQLNWTVDQ